MNNKLHYQIVVISNAFRNNRMSNEYEASREQLDAIAQRRLHKRKCLKTRYFVDDAGLHQSFDLSAALAPWMV